MSAVESAPQFKIVKLDTPLLDDEAKTRDEATGSIMYTRGRWVVIDYYDVMPEPDTPPVVTSSSPRPFFVITKSPSISEGSGSADQDVDQKLPQTRQPTSVVSKTATAAAGTTVSTSSLTAAINAIAGSPATAADQQQQPLRAIGKQQQQSATNNSSTAQIDVEDGCYKENEPRTANTNCSPLITAAVPGPVTVTVVLNNNELQNKKQQSLSEKSPHHPNCPVAQAVKPLPMSCSQEDKLATDGSGEGATLVVEPEG